MGRRERSTAMQRARPPEDREALFARARRIAGLTIGELSAALGASVPALATQRKGFVGQLVEAALGASAGSRAEPDFPRLGIELKTIPVSPSGRPKESTFVCSIALGELATTDFEDSVVWKKLASVLFVPVEHGDGPLEGRRLGTPLFWAPSAEERAVLEADWDLLAGRIAEGELDTITAHLGEALQVRPKAAHGRSRRLGPAAEGGLDWTLPRGFYLRARFTEVVLRRALSRGGSEVPR